MNEIFGIPADSLLRILLGLSGLILAIVAFAAWRYPLPFRLGIRNLRRHRSQTALIIGGLALSTMIITSALGIGDTIDYSTKVGVYDNLGNVDIQVSMDNVAAPSGFSLGGGTGGAPSLDAVVTPWFNAAAFESVAGLVDGDAIDAAVPIVSQLLPVTNTRSRLSEAAVEIRGIGAVVGTGLTQLPGLAQLRPGQALINASLAQQLEAEDADTLAVIKGQPAMLQVAGIVPDGELAGSGPALLLPLANAQALLDHPGGITAILVSSAGGVESGADTSPAAVAQLQPLAGTLVVNEVKADALQAAESSAGFITTLFVTFGTFSILSGVLLIFLIFTVLAAERRSEMGISRAIGQQRSDLIRQFVTEGLAYNLIAAAVGMLLGVAAAILLAGTLLDLLVGSAGLNIAPRVSPRSAVIGYTLGLVITFFTVVLSAARISQVNIIAAIRDLNLPEKPRERQWTLFLHPFLVWRQALRNAGQGNYVAALRLFLLGGPKAIYDFWMGLLARGPLLLVLGYLFAWVGVNVAGQAGVYGMGVAFFFIGLGQLAAWLILPARWAYTFVGLALVLYWSLPARSVGALAELETNSGDFFISGLFMVGGAILLFLFNAELLLDRFAGLLSRLGGVLPVSRVAIAYPVAAKGRTATTLAMFSLVIFTLVGTATISNTFSNFLDVESGSGGYDVLVQANPFNPVSPQDFEQTVQQGVQRGETPQPEAWATSIFAAVQGQSPDMARPAGYAINGVNQGFFDSQRLELAGLARGYTSPEAVWQAVQADPGLVVIDGFSLDRTGDPTFQADADAFRIASIQASDSTFDPVTIMLTGRDGVARPFTVIGTLGTAPAFYGAIMNEAAAQSLGFTTANRYFIRLPQGADVRAAANAIESALSESGVQTTLIKQELAEGRSSVQSVFYLVQGFVGLGLLIGIAALGVITIRSVVERRQQIGVLRAIGFQQEMVQGVFLLENMFVGGLASVIGYSLALAFSYNLYLQVAADQGLPFLPPWPLLIAIGAALFATALAVAWIHSRQAARVVIAEALRYQG
jgi:putative ABC transport system permease protein